MEDRILGLHHITAIAGNAKRTLEFYTKILGLRLVKKTVNFDDPGTYHFYFGDEKGTPGSILTFFPWAGVRRGQNGAGMATGIGYSVPADSLSFWKDRFERFNVKQVEIEERFGEKYLHFRIRMDYKLISSHLKRKIKGSRGKLMKSKPPMQPGASTVSL